jgi:hypothetical protein
MMAPIFSEGKAPGSLAGKLRGHRGDCHLNVALHQADVDRECAFTVKPVLTSNEYWNTPLATTCHSTRSSPESTETVNERVVTGE